MGYLKKTILPAGLGIAMTTVAMLPAIAGQTTSSSLRQGLPGRRISGGTRSECMVNQSPIVALNPRNNIGETLSAAPSVYFVIPELEKDYLLEFSLRDSDGNRIFEKSLNTHESAGVIGIQLPADALKVNQDYRWHMAVVCDSQDRVQDDVLSGWLRHVEAEVAVDADLNEANVEAGLTLAASYQAAGLWSDAIATVVALREQHPTDESVRSSWHQLLQSLEIDHSVSTQIAMTQ